MIGQIFRPARTGDPRGTRDGTGPDDHRFRGTVVVSPGRGGRGHGLGEGRCRGPSPTTAGRPRWPWV